MTRTLRPCGADSHQIRIIYFENVSDRLGLKKQTALAAPCCGRLHGWLISP
jgi:hypothetical protein